METKNETKFTFLEPCEYYEGMQIEIIKFLNNINPNDVEKIYYGKQNSCRCGCKGEYYSNYKDKEQMISIAIDNLIHANLKDIKLLYNNDKLKIIEVSDNQIKNFCVAIYLEQNNI